MASRLLHLFVVLLLLILANDARGTVGITWSGSGTVTNQSVVQSGGAWDVYCTATGLTGQVLDVFVNTDSPAIFRSIIIDAKGGPTCDVRLTVRATGTGGKVVRVENVFPDLSNSDANDAEL